MIIDILRRGGAKAADKIVASRLAFGATGFVSQRRRVVSLAGAGFAAVIAVAAGAAGDLHYASLASNERQAAVHAEMANAALQDELNTLMRLGSELPFRRAAAASLVLTPVPGALQVRLGRCRPPDRRARDIWMWTG